jgi:hypothetical protein
MQDRRRFVIDVVAGIALTAAAGRITAAGTVIGRVLAVRGEVFVDEGATPQRLIDDSPVHGGDTIVTRAGKAKIALADGTVVSIGENTRWQLGDLAGRGSAARLRTTLLSGVLRPIIDKAKGAGGFEVETETAIAAVRGTDWLIEATPERTSVAVLRGIVAVTGRAEPQRTVLLQSPGQGTDVPRGAPPTDPVPWGIRRLADTMARATFA